MSMIRKRIVFSGAVQGVGFRYRAVHGAEHFGCTGWVRNDWEGTVTMEIQGNKEQIDKVLEVIAQGRYVDILGMDSKIIPVAEQEYGFKVKSME